RTHFPPSRRQGGPLRHTGSRLEPSEQIEASLKFSMANDPLGHCARWRCLRVAAFERSALGTFVQSGLQAIRDEALCRKPNFDAASEHSGFGGAGHMPLATVG